MKYYKKVHQCTGTHVLDEISDAYKSETENKNTIHNVPIYCLYY
jgi:hypothetical protein